MKIGIMGAMPEEINSIISHVKNATVIELGSRKYFSGTIGQHEIVLVFSRCGKVAAATTATTLIAQFKINQLIFTGVAGATNPCLNIGDIVIANNLYQHDMDARPIMPRFEIPLTGRSFFNTDSALLSNAHKSVNQLFAMISSKISNQALRSFYITNPKCIIGIIATGDQFINNAQSTLALTKEVSDTLAVEMEGAAVAQVCHDYNIPFIVIRTISDKANHDAQIDFQKFIDNIACHYSEHIILNMLT